MPNPNFSIRNATLDDAEQIIKLRKRIDKDKTNKNPPLDPYGGDYPSLEQQISEIKDYLNDSAFLVAINGKNIVGIAFCFQMYDLPGEYRVKFMVDNTWRNKGIGTSLISHIVEWSQAHSQVQKLICSFHKSHKSAENVLKKFGFKIVNRGLVYYMQAAMYDATEMSLEIRNKKFSEPS